MQHPTQTVNREGGCEMPAGCLHQRLVPHHGRTHLDLFSGIGGFAIAASSAGFQTIGFSEIEPHSCAVLKQHWPEIKNYGDIRNIRNVPADLVTGGFPCQPFSVAGKRGGTSDDRALWPEMRRVIAESKPTYVLGENVAGIVSMELDSVLDDLEHLGYAAWPIIVPACAVDARHRRDRVWILGYSDSVRSRRAENGQGHHAGNNGDAKRPDELCEPARPSGARKENVADANGQLLDYWDDIPLVYAGSVVHPEAVLQPGTCKKAHPCQMPTGIVTRALMFSSDVGDTVLDPFNGSGTSAVAAKQLNRQYIGIEQNPEYVQITKDRLQQDALALGA